MKKKGIVILLVCVFMIAMGLGVVIYLSEFHIRFGGSYRGIEGYENIVFMDDFGENTYFRLCPWGLMKTENYDGFQDNRNFDKSSYEYQMLNRKIDASNVEQVVLSPDGNYILYAEHIYRGTGVTDDEDVYYRVYSIKSEEITTVFSGYRQFLLVDWKGGNRG